MQWRRGKFILLDEPFAGVDPIAVEDIQRVVAKLKTKNIGITEDELKEKVEEIRAAEDLHDSVRFAIGCSYVDDKTNIRTALRIADELMYEDKRLYYEKHPELKH